MCSYEIHLLLLSLLLNLLHIYFTPQQHLILIGLLQCRGYLWFLHPLANPLQLDFHLPFLLHPADLSHHPQNIFTRAAQIIVSLVFAILSQYLPVLLIIQPIRCGNTRFYIGASCLLGNETGREGIYYVFEDELPDVEGGLVGERELPGEVVDA